MAGPRMFSTYDQEFWNSIEEGQLRLQRCVDCNTFRYPPGACCPECLSTDATWQAVTGRGKVLSWATFHKQYLPAYPVPTTIVAAILEEGTILITNIDPAETGNLALDQPIRVAYAKHPDGYAIPRFTLVS